jgi:hypothetical protein
MKLSIPISIIIASVVLVIGYFGMEYYKDSQIMKSCEILKADYQFEENKKRAIAKCFLENR